MLLMFISIFRWHWCVLVLLLPDRYGEFELHGFGFLFILFINFIWFHFLGFSSPSLTKKKKEMVFLKTTDCGKKCSNHI